jgi:D-glycero-alpha-D-manno-heptose-7-phosphate kinase
MIITRTPFRVSFAGGGSDIPEFYQEHSGAVLSVTINKYMYLTMHPYFHDKKILLKYSKTELVDNPGQIEHRILREVLAQYQLCGIDFNSIADVPAGTGLGSSSAFTVGLIQLCHAYLNRAISREKIANLACDVEINRLKEPIGKQDQYASAMGGLNFIRFHQDDSVAVDKIIMKKEALSRLQNNLFMFYLGDNRSVASVLTEQKDNMKKHRDKRENMKKMVQLAYDLRAELENGNVEAMGTILHTGWMYKKEMASTISSARIDHYYAKALEHGATGGKLLGAGGGGFLLFYAPEDRQASLRSVLSDLEEYPFEFDNTGTTVIYYA